MSFYVFAPLHVRVRARLLCAVVSDAADVPALCSNLKTERTMCSQFRPQLSCVRITRISIRLRCVAESGGVYKCVCS